MAIHGKGRVNCSQFRRSDDQAVMVVAVLGVIPNSDIVKSTGRTAVLG